MEEVLVWVLGHDKSVDTHAVEDASSKYRGLAIAPHTVYEGEGDSSENGLNLRTWKTS
jgi:hypothetical protein